MNFEEADALFKNMGTELAIEAGQDNPNEGDEHLPTGTQPEYNDYSQSHNQRQHPPESVHVKCKQERRITALEKGQSTIMESIDTRLGLIWTAIKEGDNQNTQYIFLVVGMFLGAIVTLIAILK